MKTPIEKLAMMANQIALFFKSYPHDEAVAGVYSHIEAFWTPKMIATLREGMGDAERHVDPLVIEALTEPNVDARDPADKSDAGPEHVGELGAADGG